MIRSMTGFGRSTFEEDGREYLVEIKSVNNRYTDISIKMPKTISFAEEKLKKKIMNNINRGKIDVYITFNNYSNLGKNIKINEELAKMYIEELKKLSEDTNIKNDISVMNICKFPDVLDMKCDENEEIILKELNNVLSDALKNLINMRENEGKNLLVDMEQRLDNISKKVKEISKFSTGLISEYVVKLKGRIEELLKSDIIDENRLAQEVVIFADKCSVEEEITRLESHISQFLNLLKDNKYEPIGKKLDFIIQEMNRETNTIASKANCLPITNLVIDVKTELENIREQVQNVE